MKKIELGIEAAKELQKKLQIIKKAEHLQKENQGLKEQNTQLKNAVEALKEELDSQKEADYGVNTDIGTLSANDSYTPSSLSCEITEENYDEEAYKLASRIQENSIRR